MSTKVTTSLMEKLQAIRAREGLSGNEFARRLGISPQLYHMTKTGTRDIGLEVLKAIAKAYPELNRAVLIFLSGDVEVSSVISDLSTTTPEKPQDGKIRALRARPINAIKDFFKKLFLHWGKVLKPKSER